MTHTYEKLSSNKVKVTLTFPAADFEAAVQQAYVKARKNITVPGFRKGKAPRKVIENMYGKQVFYEDAIDSLFGDAYSAVIDEEKIEVVDRPEADVNWAEIDEGKDLVITCEVYVRPDVTLGEYKNLKIEVPAKHVVTEEEVTAKIDADRNEASSTADVDDRAVQDGDTVNLDYAGTVDGVAFEGGTANGQTLKIGSNQFIPGFEAQMIGMEIGEEKDLNVKFPEEYHAKELAGKDAVFHVKVNGITVTEIPAADDDFGVDKGFDDFASYKASVEKDLNDRADKNYEISVENKLVEVATNNATIDVPAAMIREQQENILRNMEMQMMYSGLRMDDYLKYTGMTREALADQYKDEADRRVRMELTLEAIRKAEGIEPKDEDIEKQIAEQAERMGQDVETFKKNLTETQRGYLADSAAIQLAIDMMRASAEVTDEAPKAEETKEETAE